MKQVRKRMLCLLLAFLVALPLHPEFARAAEEDMVTTLRPSETSELQDHYFSYTAYDGKSWTSNDSEAYIDLGTSDAKAEECYYEVHFTGSAISIYAVKAPAHGKVKFTVDGGNEEIVDLYKSGDREEQKVYTVSGLAEGEHVLRSVTLNEKSGEKVVNQVAYAQITHKQIVGDPDLGGTIEDTNWQYTNDRYKEISRRTNAEATLYAWKNDKAASELVLYSKNCSLKNVSVTASELTDGTNTIAAENVKTTFIRSTKAYNQGRGYEAGGLTGVFPATEANRSDSADILWQEGGSVEMAYNTLQPIWVEFNIPKDARAGTYTGTITATADGIAAPLTFTYTVVVQKALLPDAETFKDTFDIELWQYPYVSAEYYDVESFSEEHFKILESSMQIYKEIGGHAITASIVENAWSGNQSWDTNDIPYPSMVKWIKNSDGSFSYDYTDFDKWVEFCKGLGIGDKIVLYSIAPWHFSFKYWENGELKTEPFTAGTERYEAVWTDFLQNMANHLEEKGWFDDAYVGVDEKGFSTAAFDVIASIKNSEGKSLKAAGAMDSFMEKKDLAMRVADLNVGGVPAWADPDDFAKLLDERTAKGLRTTLYSCTGHRPGNFSLSIPAESYWTIINAGKMNGAGFLRWAYDAWWQGGDTVGDPLNDATHSMFEPGDTFLIFPDEKDAAEPKSRYSVRLARMAEGVRDVNKLRLIEKEAPGLADEIKELYNTTSTQSVWNTGAYLSDAEKNKLAGEMTAFKEGLAKIGDRYVEVTGGVDEPDLPGPDDPNPPKPDNPDPSKPNNPDPSGPDNQNPPQPDNPTPQPEGITEGKVYQTGGYSYKVTSVSGKTVTVTKVNNIKVKKIAVPDTVKLDNNSYRVTAVADGAFKNCKQAASAKVGKNVESIGKNAFAGCTKLKTVALNSKKLNTIGNKAFSGCKALNKITVKSTSLKAVGKNAFKGIGKKAQIKVPPKKLKKYKNLFAKKGQAKTVKIK